MKYELARDIKIANTNFGVGVPIELVNDYYTFPSDISSDDIAHKDAIDPSLIRQVPEVGDYLIPDEEINTMKVGKPYLIVDIDNYKRLWLNNDNNVRIFIRISEFGEYLHIATPEEIADWQAKQHPVEKTDSEKITDITDNIINLFDLLIPQVNELKRLSGK